jgi:hypothetical protein
LLFPIASCRLMDRSAFLVLWNILIDISIRLWLRCVHIILYLSKLIKLRFRVFKKLVVLSKRRRRIAH